MKLFRKDPSEGLREIIAAYGGLLTAVVTRILKSPEEAEECVADVFVSLWKNADNLRKPESLKGFLLCAARNNAVNRYHSLKRHNCVYIDETDGFEIIADDDVELLVIKNEFMDELQKIIMKMPEPNREIFMMKYFLFEPVRDIAAKFGLSEVQVKDRLYRMRNQIRKKFEKRGTGYEKIIFTQAR